MRTLPEAFDMEKQLADKYIYQYMDRIFGFALDKLHTIDGARELASDIVYEVYRSFLKADSIVNIDGYVYRIARNVYAHYIGSLAHGRNFVSIDGMVIAAPEDTTAEEAETEQILRREIGYLSQRQRTVIYMHYYEKRTVAEIADKLKISQGTVKWHLSDARSRLKEGINMNINEQNTQLNPIRFTHMGHSGSPGANGDTNAMFDTRLKQNIAWACYSEPKTLEEIARAVGVPQVYVSDDLKKLVEYAYIDRLDNTSEPKYRTNMLLYDGRDKADLSQIYSDVAQFICDKYLPKLFEEFENDKEHWGISCDGGDINFLKYSVVMLAVRRLILFDEGFEKEFEKYTVKRPDGGDFIAHANVEDDISITAERPNPYWCCGYMTRGINEAPAEEAFESISVDCRYTDRSGGWQDNLQEDWQKLTKFIRSGKGALSQEGYKRLCDKGYLYEDRVQPAVMRVKSSQDIASAFYDILNEKIAVPDEVADFARKMDEMVINENKKHFPQHMHKTLECYYSNCLGSGMMIPKVIEILLERGVLRPLSEIQKKAALSVLCIIG